MTDFCKECKAPLEGFSRYCVRCGADNGEATKKECSICGDHHDSNAAYCSKTGYNIRKYESLKNEYHKNTGSSNRIILIVFLAWTTVLFFSVKFDFQYFYLYFFLSTAMLISVGVIWLVGQIRQDIGFQKKIKMFGKKS